MRPKPRDIDACLARIPEDKREALERLLVCFGAARNHCSLYPMSASVVVDHEDLLAQHDTSKGTIRFQPDKPLPAALVRRLVKARITENRAKSKVRGGGWFGAWLSFCVIACIACTTIRIPHPHPQAAPTAVSPSPAKK